MSAITRNEWILAGTAATVPVIAVAGATRVAVGVSGAATAGYAPDSLHIYGPVWRTVAWIGLAIAAALVVTALVRLRRRWRPALLVIAGLVLAGAAACYGTFRYSFEAAPRVVLPAHEASDGERYVVVRYAMMQAMTLRICRVEREDAWGTDLSTLASARFDSPRIYQHVLVPEGAGEPASWLYESPDGAFLVCASHGDAALLRVYVACHLPSEAAYANEGAYYLSPFALFGPDDVGNDDALDLLAAFVMENPEPPGVPLDDVLARDLDHASPWVRDAVARLVEAGGPERYPAATRELRDRR